MGSRLNFENRHKIQHTAYVKASLRDTISISGIQDNGNYWKEYIVGDIMVGYVNASFLGKKDFERAILSIKKKLKN